MLSYVTSLLFTILDYRIININITIIYCKYNIILVWKHKKLLGGIDMTNILMNKVMKSEQISYLEEKYGLKIYVMENDELPDNDILQGIEIFVGWRPEKLIEAMPSLKWIHLYSAGVDRYIEIFRKMSSPPRLTNNRGTYAVPLSEHSLALLFAVIRKINTYVKNQTERNWHYEGRVREICGSTVGIVGFGDVGRYSARMMKGLGAEVLANRLHKSEKPNMWTGCITETKGWTKCSPNATTF